MSPEDICPHCLHHGPMRLDPPRAEKPTRVSLHCTACLKEIGSWSAVTVTEVEVEVEVVRMEKKRFIKIEGRSHFQGWWPNRA